LLKETENPPISRPQGQTLSDFSGTWWVAHTKARNEKALAWDISRKQISYFLPMSPRVRRHRGRTIRSLLPLFAGYLFFCGDENQRLEVLRTNRVANLIKVEDQQKLVKELTQIQLALNAGAALRPHKYIEAGRLCRVTAGPLADLQGIFVKSRGDSRLILKIDMLGQATSTEIDADMVEPVET